MSRKKLTDICSIQYGFPFDSALFSSSPNDGMPLIRIRDVNNGYTSTYYKGEYLDEYVVHKGEYLIGMDGEFNIAIWRSDDALLNQRVCKISSKSEDVSTEYLYRFLKKELKVIENETPFVTVKHLSAKRLNQVYLVVPPIAEQERIVRELDLLSGIIDKQRTQLRELDTLAQSIFYSTFGDPITNEKGWEVIEMDKLYDIGSSKRVFEAQWTDSGVPFYRAREIVKLSKNEPIESPIFIPESLYREYSEKYGVPSEGDMMVTAVGTLGVCYIVKSSDRFYFKDGNTLWFKSKGLCETRFIKDQYSTSFVKNQIQGNANAAVVGTYTIINAKKTKVIVPPIALQKEYVEKIETIEKQKELIKQSISETEALFNSRMDYYFD